MKTAGFSRRHLLRAAGATVLVPRFLRTAFAAPETLPPRLLIYMQANGTHPETYWPDATFRSPALAPMLEDARLAPRTTVVRGLALGIAPERRLGNGHDQGFSSLWTGVPQVGTQSESWGGGPSLDQQVKRALDAPLRQVPFPTLNCGLHACVIAPKNGHRYSFSYTGARRHVPTEIDPLKLWTALFEPRDPDETPEQAAARAAARLRKRRSVLDAVTGDLQMLSARVGPAERAKLELHATGLRELEGRLGTALLAAPPGARCGRPPMDAGVAGTALDPGLESNIGTLVASMRGLVTQALACNVVRIVTFQAGYSGNNWRYGWLDPPLNRDSHGEIAHADGGGNADAAHWMTEITKWHARNVAQIASAWLDTPDVGGGNVLDESLLVWANENSNGSHGLEDLPVALLGTAGGRIKSPGRVLDTAARATGVNGLPDVTWTPHQELGATVMRLMGVDVKGFGDKNECAGLAL